MKISPALRSAPRPAANGHFLVLQGVARTFLPTDVHAALKEIGATRSGAPTLVTKQPTPFTPLPTGHASSPPRSSSTFHLTFPSAESLRLASIAIDRSPTRFLGFPGGPQPADATGKVQGKRSARGRVFVRKVEQDATRWLMTDAAREWTSAHRTPGGPSTSSDGPREPAEDSQNPGTLAHYLSQLRQRNPAPFDPAKRGLQVVLRGVPQSAGEGHVRRLVEGFKVDDTYGIWRVPKIAKDTTSTHIISLPTASEAHRFVRAVHNRRYGGHLFDRDYVMRAEVVW
ncbi:hypothetical protein QFC20_000257 [Naganishia adeliensis]|uniref:Uncharacterized protein n=1 Tax=Naganishia adeliensis TaxID=92952 RepID=A0ACC2X3J3_9TREE|nr:hypothetical protein QFC20_000257 [Naganishia adeliensis]